MGSTSLTRSSSESRRAKRRMWIRSTGSFWRRPGRRWRMRASSWIWSGGQTSRSSLEFLITIIKSSRAAHGIPTASVRTLRRDAHSIAANRISYCFNLRGPSIALDTACSSALTAVHIACEHIWSGHGETALAGGVTVMITQGGFIGFSQARCSRQTALQSIRCLGQRFRPRRRGGDGRAQTAVQSPRGWRSHPRGDRGISHRIRTDTPMGSRFPAPKLRHAWCATLCQDAEIDPSADWVSSRLTGPARRWATRSRLMRWPRRCAPDRPADAPLAIGSVKTNLGHLETAAGVAGLVKAALVLKHGQIPASLHFETPNPHIDFAALKLRVPTELEAFPKTVGARLAGVNSFGFGGSNSHVILAEPPPRPHATFRFRSGRAWPLMLSARSEGALRSSAHA